MKTLQLGRFLTPILLLLFLFSCEEEKQNSENNTEASTLTIVETAQSTPALSLLVDALTKADEREGSDLISALSSEGPFTVFAPTNEAFAALLAQLDGYDSLEDFDTDEEKELLGLILQYHVIAGAAARSTDLEAGQELPTLQGEILTVSLNDGVFIQDKTETAAEVTTPNVENSNGIVHIINKVLLPQEILDALQEEMEEQPNLVELVVATESLSLLEQAVIKADLVDTLSSEGPFTVFAPTDDAFVALLEVLGEQYASLDDFDTDEEIALLRNILLYHVLPIQVLEADLAAGSVATAFEGNNIEVISEGESFVLGDASDVNAIITGTDITASNGVAHTINKVLLPQAALDFVAELQLKTIAEIAIATDDLSLLVDALVQVNAGLVETLGGEGSFTVFAPTNQAFVDLLDILGEDYTSLSDFDTEEEIALLTDILKYHVVVGLAAFSGDLSEGQAIETFLGDAIEVSLDGGVFIIDASGVPAEVALADIEASNGVVHVLNKVLLPQAALDFVAELQLKNIAELAIATDDLSLLVDALVRVDAGLVEALGGEGPFTVFAPTNMAFVNLLEVLGDDYNSLSDFDTEEEIALLVDILKYHVAPGNPAFAENLIDGQQINTLLDQKIKIRLDGGVFVEDATDDLAEVVLADQEATNGVVHIINKVLLPQAALDFLASLQTQNIVELAQSVPELSILVEALIQADAGLLEALSSGGPLTVFAPTNDAFERLFHDLGSDYHGIEDFDTQEEKALLAEVLKYHVLTNQRLSSENIQGHFEVHTLQGEDLGVGRTSTDRLILNDPTNRYIQIIGIDNEASNGIVHLINRVLIPQEVLNALH